MIWLPVNDAGVAIAYTRRPGERRDPYAAAALVWAGWLMPFLNNKRLWL
jgi:hypothetical protein